jgi:hypothetical protein
MSIFYEGPNFFASPSNFMVELDEKFCQELATLIVFCF